jgi:hypothetical protein
VTWLAWRQQRTETAVTVLLVVLLAALLVPTGLDMASDYDASGLASCVGTRSPLCAAAISSFHASIVRLDSIFPWFNLLLGLIGALLAAPLLLEFDAGTYKLAWTQSVTRRRWLTVKLAITIGTALATALLLTALTTWWRTPLDHLEGRIQPNTFDFEGTVGLAYVLFALGATLAVGALWRRTVPSLAVGFAVYTISRLFVILWLRQRFVDPLAATWPSERPGPNLAHAWVLSEGPSDRLGHPFSGPFGVGSGCTRIVSGFKEISGDCLARHGGGYVHAVWQPAGRFWLFQGIETSLFGGLGLLLVLFAAWALQRRPA